MNNKYLLSLISLVFLLLCGFAEAGFTKNTKDPILIHVKTSLSVDDAQICVFPNVAWAALNAGKAVTIVFDGSAVTSIAKGFGWRGWVGIKSTAMQRAKLPERERKALAAQLKVPLEKVPHNYGDYLELLKTLNAKVYYNTTMALLYNLKKEQIDEIAQPLNINELLSVLEHRETYLVY